MARLPTPVRDASGHKGANSIEPGRGREVRGGLYDSVERHTLATPASAYVPAMYNPDGDGVGGVAGHRDPYDRPTRSQLAGTQSRLRQDKASGALDKVAGRYRVLFGGHQLVRKGLRRSIADAYATYVGQVVSLPEDTYGLALRALDRTFNPRGVSLPGVIDQHLHASPFLTSRARHVQIFNTAHKIMRDLEGYVYGVSYYCPSELDQLHGMRRPASAAANSGGGSGSGGSHKFGRRLDSAAGPSRDREAAAVAPPRRPISTPFGVVKRAADQRPSTSARTSSALTPRPSAAPNSRYVNPITGAARIQEHGMAVTNAAGGYVPGSGNRREAQPSEQSYSAATAATAATGAVRRRRPLVGQRPQTATTVRDAAAGDGSGDGRGGDAVTSGAAATAAAMRSVAAALGAAAEAEAEGAERIWGRSSGGGGGGVGDGGFLAASEQLHPTEDRLRRNLRRRSSAGMYANTPPHYCVAKYYDHVVPSQEMWDLMRERARAAAAPVAGPEAGAGHLSERLQYTGSSTPPSPSPPPFRGSDGVDGDGARVGGPYTAAAAVASVDASQRHLRGHVGNSRRGDEGHQRLDLKTSVPDPAGTDQLLRIIESAHGLGLPYEIELAEPPPYPRSHRLYPNDHRRQFYEGVYSSPERYTSYTPYVPPLYNTRVAGGQEQVVGPRSMADQFDTLHTYLPAPPGGGPGIGAAASRYKYEYDDGPTAERLQAAAARRFVREAVLESEAQIHPRSRRLSP